MSESNTNSHERDLLALMKPFGASEASNGELQAEAHALLAFVDKLLAKDQSGPIASRISEDNQQET